jgi:hypothetical protein
LINPGFGLKTDFVALQRERIGTSFPILSFLTFRSLFKPLFKSPGLR